MATYTWFCTLCTLSCIEYVPRPLCVAHLQGVQLNAVDGVGNTPLMDAIRHSHKEVQAALRLAGANLSAVNVADKLCLAAAENDTATLEVCLHLVSMRSPRYTLLSLLSSGFSQ